MEKTALYAGSFDPFTNGHLDIVRDAAKVFDRVYVCISENSNKKRFTDVNLIASAITATLEYEGLTNCVVVYHKGLIADFCKSHNLFSSWFKKYN